MGEREKKKEGEPLPTDNKKKCVEQNGRTKKKTNGQKNFHSKKIFGGARGGVRDRKEAPSRPSGLFIEGIRGDSGWGGKRTNRSTLQAHEKKKKVARIKQKGTRKMSKTRETDFCGLCPLGEPDEIMEKERNLYPTEGGKGKRGTPSQGPGTRLFRFGEFETPNRSSKGGGGSGFRGERFRGVEGETAAE